MCLSSVTQPIGAYDVVGVNPGDSKPYDRTVAVEINDATYTVIWQVDGEEYIGTAIGAANLKGSIIFGEAVESDTSLAVSYGTGDTFGLALFVRAMARVYGLMVPPTPSVLKRGHSNDFNRCMLVKITSGNGKISTANKLMS